MEGDVKPDETEPIKTRIDYRGRIYIPVKIRKKLRLKPDEEIDLNCEDNQIILSPCRTRIKK